MKLNTVNSQKKATELDLTLLCGEVSSNLCLSSGMRARVDCEGVFVSSVWSAPRENLFIYFLSTIPGRKL
jgi:hypothetical protein